jgi:hypothetical protein
VLSIRSSVIDETAPQKAPFGFSTENRTYRASQQTGARVLLEDFSVPDVSGSVSTDRWQD